MWQIYENLRAKIADRIKMDWPVVIASLVGDTCSCEIESITSAIANAGVVSFGLNGIADSWLCEVVDVITKL
jgi:hypothetical protein